MAKEAEIDEEAVKRWAAASRFLPGAGGELGGLADRILNCGKKTWSSLRNALGIKTREAAVELCTLDPKARKIAVQLLDAEDAKTTGEIIVPPAGTRKPGKVEF